MILPVSNTYVESLQLRSLFCLGCSIQTTSLLSHLWCLQNTLGFSQLFCIIRMTGWIERQQHKSIPGKVSQWAMPCRAVQGDNIRNYHWTSCYEFFFLCFSHYSADQCWNRHPPQHHYTTVKREKRNSPYCSWDSIFASQSQSFFLYSRENSQAFDMMNRKYMAL